jgi:hypothetical protein
MKINRMELINEIKEEKLLRENIRKVIKIVRERKQLKLQERQEGEQHMRKIIRHLIKEAEVADEDPAPGPTTGRNALDQLLKKIIPILEENYKLLTTDKAQRDSFRAHIVNAIKNSLKPSRLPDPGEGPAQEAGKLKEEIEIDIEDDIPEEDEMPPEFIDINQDGKPDEEEEELSPQEEFGTGLEDHDITGRNFAYEAYKKVEKVILDGYDLVADSPKDSKIFYDYLLTNVKLYFDRFEDDLAGTVDEPTTPEYEQAKDEEPAGEEMPAGEEEGLEL